LLGSVVGLAFGSLLVAGMITKVTTGPAISGSTPASTQFFGNQFVGFEYPSEWHIFTSVTFDDANRVRPEMGIYLDADPISVVSPSDGPMLATTIRISLTDEGEAILAPYENGYEEYKTDQVTINGWPATRIQVKADAKNIYAAPYSEILFVGGYKIVHDYMTPAEANEPAWELLKKSLQIYPNEWVKVEPYSLTEKIETSLRSAPLEVSYGDTITGKVYRYSLATWLNDHYNAKIDPKIDWSKVEGDLSLAIDERVADVLVENANACMSSGSVSSETARILSNVGSSFVQRVVQVPDTMVYEYQFSYVGQSQDSGTWTVYAVPNTPEFANKAAFKKAMDFCDVGGMYPKGITANEAANLKANSSFLVFETSCGTGYDDGSGRAHGCAVAQDTVKIYTTGQ
jgi:hypothetical protein